VAKAQFDGDWAALALRLPVNGMAQQLALNSELAGWDGNRLALRVAESQRHLAEKAYLDKLRAALEQALGGRVQLAVEVGGGLEDTAALRERREKAEQLAKARESFAADPFVKDVLGQMGGRIREDSVRPTN
jgi:DNA polymerase-3 subunit gamma/tau